MSLKLTHISAAGVAIAIAAIAQPAQAITFSAGTGLTPTNAIQVNFDDFSRGKIVDPITVNDDFTITSTGGLVEITPLKGNGDKELDLGSGSAGGEATLTFNSAQNYLGFEWASFRTAGPTDEIVRFFSDGSLIESFTGTQINSLSGVSNGSSAFINFFASPDDSDAWDEVVFNVPAEGSFRIDDLAYREVPTPALLPGLIGMGVAAFRKKQQQPECAEA